VCRAARGDDLGDGPGFFFDPQVRTSTLLSAFVQDDVRLTPNRLSLIVGTKIERNDFTGVELQPNLRFRFAVNAAQTAWAAVSRAVRMPTRFDTDLRIRNLLTNQLQITGRTDFDSEDVTAYEAGYRLRPTARVSIDLATYFNRWNDLRSLEYPTTAGSPVMIGNMLNADTSGAEVAATASITSAWQAHGSYTYLWRRVSFDAGSHDPTRGANEANDPSHLASIRNSFDLRRHVEADFTVRYVSRLPQPAVKAYTELSGRLGWRPSTHWDFSIGGENLLHDRHEEFAAGTPRELFERSVYLRSVWNF
jgi:iron complex outermembrane recepter protein